MPDLQIFPTSRSIRERVASLRTSGGFLPRLMRMDEFLTRAAVVPDRRQAEASERIFWLREAADFEDFGRLGSERDLVRFFTRSSDFFRFFEELAWEKVPLERLEEADAYAEYADHLRILGELRERYRAILDREGAYDRIFLPELYRINEAFLGTAETLELYLEGTLSRFELELLEAAAQRRELRIHWRTTPYNEKMRQRFAEMGLDLPGQSRVVFSLSQKELIESEPLPLEIDAKVLAVRERYEQVAVALAEIEGMVRAGIAPERIALVLPDESFMRAFDLYDRMENLNFSMGYDYRDRPEYRVPATLLEYWRGFSSEDRELLEHYGFALDRYRELEPSAMVTAEVFYESLQVAGIPGFIAPEVDKEPSREAAPIQELWHRFLQIHQGRRLAMRDWLFLWLEELGQLRLDDVRGGKVTVMGVLETRGVHFDGVVIVDFNEGIVPASSGKDRFLDSRVRRFAGLPDRLDREALQKHYYARLLEGAQKAVILYTAGESRLPSRLLYELGLEEGETVAAPRELLYSHTLLPKERKDPAVESFDPLAMQWSASRLKIWLECRRRFYYRYILGLEEKRTEEINEGQVLHRVLERLFADRDRFEDPEAMRRRFEILAAQELERSGIAGRYLQAYWSRKLVPYFRQETERFAQGWRVEARERNIEGDIEGVRFAGRVDRIDVREGERMVLDYKSGKLTEANRKSSLERVTDFQMSIYESLLRPEYPRLDLAFVTPLEERAFVPVAALEEKNALLAEHLEELKTTRSFVAERCEDLKRCSWCPYQLLCERGEYL